MNLPYDRGEEKKNTDQRDNSLILQNIHICYTHYTTCTVSSKVHSLSLIKAILHWNVSKNQDAEERVGPHQLNFLFTWKLAKKSSFQNTLVS